MSVTSIEPLSRSRGLLSVPAWLWVGTGACVLVLLQGTQLLRDTDTFWQMKVGQWIIDNHAVPKVDVFSLTRDGTSWMSSSWLSQVMFAETFTQAGWSGVVLLSALAIALTFGLLVHLLGRYVQPNCACFVAIIAFTLSAHHFLARPHVLAMPLMVAWIGGLMAASDNRTRPSPWLLPLITLWANLHGGFVLGLALIGPIALDALCRVDIEMRKPLALRWGLFGSAAVLAACLTPYGWDSILAARKILDLGSLLTLISEWAPVGFGAFSLFEGGLLLLIGGALYSGIVLPPTRILLTLGLLHMALSHVRNIEVFVLLLPLVLAGPVAQRFAGAFGRPQAIAGDAVPNRMSTIVAVAVAALVAGTLASARSYQPEDEANYAAAVAALRAHHAERVFNDYGFGGYMIWAGMRPFIDGRAELYGEAFALDVLHATSLAEPDTFNRLLIDNRIDATLMYPTTPAARLLDHVDGWKKVYADDLAVVHVRTRPVSDGALRVKLD